MNLILQDTDRKYIRRCLELAQQGEGLTYPNPMVGSVIVHNGKIIGEGFHQKAGSPHAEVNAISSVKNQELLKESTLYVNLEPCAHYGKTSPCSLLIKQKQLKRVVIGCKDSFSQVAGKGIEMLKSAGIEVVIGVLEKESRELNRRFFTFHEKKRPYIVLKWAQTADGFLDYNRKAVKDNRPTWITNKQSLRLVHTWRSKEPSIIVGSVTALKDNPSLTVRNWSGKDPLRMVLDRKNNLPHHLSLFDGTTPTLLFTSTPIKDQRSIEQIVIDDSNEPIDTIMKVLFEKEIHSIIVEGGPTLLQAFIDKELWDEARIFTGKKWFKDGIKAPQLSAEPVAQEWLGSCELLIYRDKTV